MELHNYYNNLINTGAVGYPCYKYLHDQGDPATTNMIGNYGTEKKFIYQGQPGGRISLIRILVSIRDNANFDADKYGAATILDTGQGEGIKLSVWDDTGELYRLDGDLLIASNADWAQLAFDTNYVSVGQGSNFWKARKTFTRGGGPVWLKPNEYFCATLKGDFSGLTAHRILGQGRFIPEKYFVH